jgi:hypothetical protein
MTNSTPLSPAAQAVVDASLAVYWRPVIDTPVFHNKSIAAALRAAADQLGESRAPGAEFEDLYPRIIEVDDLLAIAAELEGADG